MIQIKFNKFFAIFNIISAVMIIIDMYYKNVFNVDDRSIVLYVDIKIKMNLYNIIILYK